MMLIGVLGGFLHFERSNIYRSKVNELDSVFCCLNERYHAEIEPQHALVQPMPLISPRGNYQQQGLHSRRRGGEKCRMSAVFACLVLSSIQCYRVTWVLYFKLCSEHVCMVTQPLFRATVPQCDIFLSEISHIFSHVFLQLISRTLTGTKPFFGRF